MSIVPNSQKYDGTSIQQQINVSIDTKKSVFNKSFDDQFNCRNAKSLIENLKAYYKPYVRSV